MRRLLTWLVVTLGIAALVRRLRRRSATPVPAAPPEGRAGEDPADELRRKLAESRGDEAGAGDAREPSVDERREEVHAEGRAAIDEMRSSSNG